MSLETENEQLRTRMGEMAAEIERLRANIERLSTSDEYWNNRWKEAVNVGVDYKKDVDMLALRLNESANHVHNIEAENARLHSVIDEANAQVVRAENAPLLATRDKVLFNGSHGHAGYVIEEQQSPAIEVTPEMLEAAQINTEIGRHVCGNWVGAYGCLEELFTVMYSAAPKQSPAVAWNDYKEELFQLRKQAENWSTKLGFIASAINSRKISLSEKEREFPHLLIERLHTDSELLKQRSESPRITEQDAREIAVAYALHRGTEYNKGYAEMFVDQFFATSEGRALLNKLNGAKNAQ